MRDDGGVHSIDLNADLGEGSGDVVVTDDTALIEVVTSANVACGYHAGDAGHMRRVCALAAAKGVRLGAHVSYLDREGFGRTRLQVSPAELADQVLHQLAALDGIARAEGTGVTHVKPHGALYNAIVADEDQAGAVVAGVTALLPGISVLGLPGSRWLSLAGAAGLRPVPEAFADRGYRADGTLVPRGSPGALIEDPREIVARVISLATTGSVTGVDGRPVRVSAESVCVHGDTPGAVGIARAVSAALTGAGVLVAPFG